MDRYKDYLDDARRNTSFFTSKTNVLRVLGLATLLFCIAWPSPIHAQETARPQTDHILVEGQITNAIGGGVDQVAVSVYRKTDDGQEGELLAEAATDAMGDFVVRADHPFHGDVVVKVAKPKFTPHKMELHLGDTEEPPYLSEQLASDLKLTGQIIDARDDKPIAEAAVTLTSVFGNVQSTSGTHGEFALHGVPAGQNELIVEAAGFGREHQEIRVYAQNEDVRIRLKPERIVKLTIVDNQGKPVPKVSVETLDQAKQDLRTSVSDDHGNIAINGLHFDSTVLQVRLTHPDFVSADDFDRFVFMPAFEARSTHSLVMARAGKIAGTIKDEKTGELLYGARVMTGIADNDSSPRDWSNPQGKYSIVGATPGPITVTVHMRGFAPELRLVHVTPGETTNADFDLRAGLTFSGIVRDEDGKPVANASVEAVKWRNSATLGLRAITNAEGRFSVGGAPLDEFEVKVEARGFETMTRAASALKDEPVFILSRAATVTSSANPLQVGDAAPDVTIKTLSGESFNFAKLQGKTVLVDFWATWCTPCIAELPHLVATYQKFGQRKDFVMISISFDFEEKALKDFIAERKMNWPQVYGEANGSKAANSAFGPDGLPACFLIGPDGKVVASDLRGEAIEKAVTNLMNSTK